MSITEIGTRRSSALSTLRVAVLMGGTSGEREVSLVSGRSVLQALERSVRLGALAAVRAIEIDAGGRWVDGGRARDAAEALESARDVDVFFLALHGGAGEDGTIQGLLAAAGRRHTGSSVGASALCMDKAATRGLAAAAGIAVAPGRVIDRPGFDGHPAAEVAAVLALGPAPDGWFVKPRRGGSSVNTHAVRVAEELSARVAEVLASGDDALVEQRIRGVEVSCGVLDSGSEAARALPPIEIQPHGERFFDYEQKYSETGAREVCPAPSLSAEAEGRVRAEALRMHRLCGCRGYSRTDFIVPEGGHSLRPVLLEVNTLPGLTPRSLFPQEARAVGVEYDDLCLALVSRAAQR